MEKPGGGTRNGSAIHRTRCARGMRLITIPQPTRGIGSTKADPQSKVLARHGPFIRRPARHGTA